MFHVGQNVVCVESFPLTAEFTEHEQLIEGKVYTVDWVGRDFSQTVIHVAEHKLPGFYWARRFRPLNQTKS